MSWQSLLSVFSSSYGALTGLTTRPLMIAETSSNETGGSKAQWITQGLLKDLPSKMPKVRAVVWFGENKDGISWAPDSSGSALSAFQQVAASPLYKGTVS
jgi:endoglucanase